MAACNVVEGCLSDSLPASTTALLLVAGRYAATRLRWPTYASCSPPQLLLHRVRALSCLFYRVLCNLLDVFLTGSSATDGR